MSKDKADVAASESITAVAALHVEEGIVYYTCKDKVSSQYMLKKRSADEIGTLYDCISGFHHVRRITKDKNGYYYVVEHSPKHHVIKFDGDWKPLRKSNQNAMGLLYDPHGIFIDEDIQRIFVCSKNKICILNTDLTICYEFMIKPSPMFITKHKDKYFVATEAAIIIITIDLHNLKFEGQICSSIIMPNRENIFKVREDLTLRGIYASKNYLYVIQFGGSGRFLCLKYHKNNIECVYADENCTRFCSKDCHEQCSPVALTYHDGTIYYSQGYYERKFHIVQVTHDGKTFESTKLFDA